MQAGLHFGVRNPPKTGFLALRTKKPLCVAHNDPYGYHMQPIWGFPHGSMFHGCKYLISPIWTTTMYYETHFLSHIIEKNVCHVLLTVILTSVLSRQFTCYRFTAFWLNVYTVWGRHKKWPQEKWGYIRFGLSVIPSFCLSFCPSVIISFPLNILRTTL